MQALFLLALSISIIIFCDVVFYVISDLKRYDIEDLDYKQYDSLSDIRYKHLIRDFNLYVVLLLIAFALFIPLSIFYSNEKQRWNSISCLIVFGVIFIWLKNHSKKINWKTLANVGERIVLLAVVGLLCWVMFLIIIANTKDIIKVDYNADGTVVICSSSLENYNGLDIIVCNMSNEIIYKKSVRRDELLLAREDKYVYDEVDGKKEVEGIIINNERFHWKYILDLKEIVNESEKYCLSIEVYQDGKKAKLVNSFLLDDKSYLFVKDNMEKEY